MDVVVVESPAKAKSINRYLGSNYKVLASYGHIRDLPPQDGSVRPEQDFSMEWSVAPRAEAHIKKIAEATGGAQHLYLATDQDREGEAIAWHVLEVLKKRKVLKDIDVKRVVFNEVTKKAVTNAIANPRDLDHALVDAYLARRALDYLVGFSLSPVLWRKLPGSRSAGRVQSVALRLICERESEIEIFRPQEYWTIAAVFLTPEGKRVITRLTHLNGQKLDRFELDGETAAKAAVTEIERHGYSVRSIERKTVQRRPSPPFTTSTLQQEASRKLRFSASQTMRLAQRLYEGVDIGGETVGLITYMRTDSVNLSQDAVLPARAMIGRDFGHNYVPDKPNVFRNKARNAQEAHEAIRPTDFSRKPRSLVAGLSENELKLYELIWNRALASQMSNAILDQTTVEIASPSAEVVFRATGSVVRFDGFMRLYLEGKDEREADSDENGKEQILPRLSEGDAVKRDSVTPEQHFTKPPPRFSEASLVKTLEELGIGRPSTYAAILQVLQDRDYVALDRRRFVPSDLGRLVTAFLTEFFRQYVENGFTARMETELDDVSNGNRKWKSLLADFWKAFSAAVESMDDLRTRDVIDKLDANFAEHFFPKREDGKDPRQCPACGKGRLGLKPKAFIGCSNYPECQFTSPLAIVSSEGVVTSALPRQLGDDPDTGLAVSVRNGPYGPYVQLGEAEKGKKPKRQSLLKDMTPESIQRDQALKLLSLPREVGEHPETRQMITAGVGRYGPYLKMDQQYVNLRDDNVLEIGINRAVDVIADAKTKTNASNVVLKSLGEHPESGETIELRNGRYGPFVKCGSRNAKLPAGQDPETVTLEQAVEWIAQKKTKGRNSGRSRTGKGRTKSRTGGRTTSRQRKKA